MDAATYLNQARRAAGLTQRQLAAKSGIPQPAIARIERRQQIPRYDTLIKLLDACDFELRLGPKRGGGVDVSLIDRWRRLTPAERAEWATGYGQLSQALQTARRVS